MYPPVPKVFGVPVTRSKLRKPPPAMRLQQLAALLALSQAKAFILEQMVNEGKAAKLKTFELPKAVHLEGELNELNQGFTIENDCLTPTFKLKRPQARLAFQGDIDRMYAALK